MKKIKTVKSPEEAGKVRRHVFGRIASIMNQIDDKLTFLEETRLRIKEIPSVKEMFTVVVAGYPNVGKSTFVRNISSAEPKVDVYPFTTKEIHVGHTYLEGKGSIQIIDTPGILDRPISKRNKIEKQAILALKHLANSIIFLLDPSETCGYSLKNQLHLFHEIKKLFKEVPLVPVLNKIDLSERSKVERLVKELDALTTISVQRKRAIETFKACMSNILVIKKNRK